MSALLTIIDPDECPRGDMAKALNWFETTCRVKGVRRTSPDEVRAFLRGSYNRADLAEAFNPRYLLEDRRET